MTRSTIYDLRSTILVTGATGFIGSHLVEELVKRKYRVIATEYRLHPRSYFYSQKLNKQVKLVKCDVCSFNSVNKIVKNNNINFIFHLAAKSEVEDSYKNPKLTLDTNIMGTVNILETARINPNIKGIIITSSDKAYGKLSKLPSTSYQLPKYLESDPLRGDHPYEVSKSSADLIAHAYFQTYHTPVTVVRFANVYGEGDLHFSRIIPGIMKALINKETLKIRSNGKFVRDYVYVKDIINGYLTLMKNFGKAKGQAFNLGTKETLSVLELIKVIEKILNIRIKYRILDTQKNEIPYQSLDYSKIQKLTNWQPKYNLEKTMSNIFTWYKKYFKSV